MCFRKLFAEALGIFAASVSVGCSVLEDRLLCPCALTLSFEKVNYADFEDVDVAVTSVDNFLFNKTINLYDYADGLVINVPKAEVKVNVVSCRDEAEKYLNSGAMKIPYGSQCPQVYMYGNTLDTRCETLADTVCLHRNFCRISIEIVSTDFTDGSTMIGLEGTVDGYSADGSISEGPFLAETIISRQCSFLVPRQKDDSLMMKIRQGSVLLRIFPIGEYIVQSGYEWSMEDLEDVSIILNYAAMTLNVSVAGSSGSRYFELEI